MHLTRQFGSQVLKGIQKDSPHPSASHVLLLPDEPSFEDSSKNFHAFQRVFEGDFELDIVFATGHRDVSHSPDHFPQAMTDRSNAFKARFQRIFPLVPAAKSQFAQYALSNMLGGIGYFYGRGIEKRGSEQRETDPYGLFSDTPCKTVFPRGFLWDSGFHNLIISRWDQHLSMEILESWYETMNSDGWIAREQVLGDEARSRVIQECSIRLEHVITLS